jgi:hypothetical protein
MYVYIQYAALEPFQNKGLVPRWSLFLTTMGEVENFSTLLIKLGRLLLSLVYIAAMIELEDEAPKILKGEKLDVDLSPLYWLMVKEIKERLRVRQKQLFYVL